MRTDAEIKDDIYRFIIGSELVESVSGVVRKSSKRPHRSEKEDIVISILSNENAQDQVATVNVNIYVKAKDIDGQFDEDTVRLKKLEKLASEIFDVFHTDEYRCELLEQRAYEVDGAGVYVINNKIKYETINEE